MSYLFCILKNETEDEHLGWVQACNNCEYDIDYEIVDLTKNDWFECALRADYDFFLARPPGETSLFKQMYDERVWTLNRVIGKNIYPSLDEILIYENKRMLSYYLKAKKIPHPRTNIFYSKEEAIDFAETSTMPVVAKTAIGASGSGVKILRNRKQLTAYIKAAFSEKGISRRWGPNLRRGEKWHRLVNRLKSIPESYRYFSQRRQSRFLDRQKYFVILQEYVPSEFEWRAVCIGESYFAHKKLPSQGEIISGTSEVSWEDPPKGLLDFVRIICDDGGLLSQAIDIFEPEPGVFLVNELQCFFGSKNPHQMIVKGKPGRYVVKDGNWIFQEGQFTSNNSYDLRLEHVCQILDRQ